MENHSIEENVAKILSELSGGNGFGEQVTLVAATKTRTPEEIGRAIRAGITAVGENKVQEFRDKYPLITGAQRHFIGNLQTNKVKYLVGSCDLIHSVGSFHLAEAIADAARRRGIVQNILAEVNLGEESKGGFPIRDAAEAYRRLSDTEGLCVMGFMAMLPAEGTPSVLADLCDRMRQLYEDAGARYLSMGMSGDYRLCLEHGSNMIRLGTAIFGERNYGA